MFTLWRPPEARCRGASGYDEPPTTFALDQAQAIGKQLGIRWDTFDSEQCRAGLEVQLQHGTVNRTACPLRGPVKGR